ncbi:carbonic anhydrase family protein [Tamlana sp. 2_MG-2023]|uniref:carbonic anhydrase n=1 Tax=unclassified Tamlana TaxID=2614803 RepID=UPI0026E34C9D|nr:MULTISPECIES: carbonic anhydrase family protein [unclassified Tamlana]MDO6759231.1 carbonic anhydrase family protein [Tamlana sp. 2_MG-2023]MDO6790630.1 carbonic anhydrase family protein [Tamlana sp. 1_MG-2023]
MQTKPLSILLTIITLVTFSCNQTEKQSATLLAQHHETKKHWSYHGETAPEHWAEIETHSDCNGNYQSPINIIHVKADSVHVENELNFEYSPNTIINDVENNGHSIQFDFEAGDYIDYKNERYCLKQIHFHEPSEHKIDGIIYPIEIHLVHTSKSGKVTVLAILGKEGKESQLFEFFESFLPLETGAKKEIHESVDLSSFFLKNKEYYTYGGSFTTPPCTESINWVVFKEPVILSVEEVLILKENMPINNYRNEQPLNDRIVQYHF